MVAFVTWLDQVKEAAPNSIDRRITRVAGTARRSPCNVTVPKDAALAVQQLAKRFRAQGRGAGRAGAGRPEEVPRPGASVLS
ncbi:hypothetical protein [Streptomyces orinoci]|uniref:Uncharacterized protein n=1 Tax=Streptomyces orinoci TaxID=67339 RepID=A0ABV3K0D8_STRON|nr:hypothetical protein [Streptomyces orinoci]